MWDLSSFPFPRGRGMRGSLRGLYLTSSASLIPDWQEARINWAFQKEQKEEVANHFHVFVGDLSSGELWVLI